MLNRRRGFMVLLLVVVFLFAFVVVSGCQKQTKPAAKPPVKKTEDKTDKKDMKEPKEAVDKDMEEKDMKDMADLNAQQKAGLKVFESKGCSACHMINGKGGNVGPDLSGAGKMHKPEEIEKQLRSPRDKMPKIDLTDMEIKDLIEYLMTLKSETGEKHN